MHYLRCHLSGTTNYSNEFLRTSAVIHRGDYSVTWQVLDYLLTPSNVECRTLPAASFRRRHYHVTLDRLFPVGRTDLRRCSSLK